MYGTREIAKNREDAEEILGSLLTIRVATAIILFGLCVLLFSIYPGNRTEKLVFLGCSCYLIARSANTEWVLRGFEKFGYVAVANFATFLLMLGLIYIFVTQSGHVVRASFLWSLSYGFGSVVLLAIILFRLKMKYKPDLNLRTWKLHLSQSLHFTVSAAIATFYRQLPIIFLGGFATAYELGVFAAPYKVVITVAGGAFFVPLAFYPVLADLHLNDREELNAAHSVLKMGMATLGIGIFLGGTFFSDQIVFILFGKEYGESLPVFKVLLLYVPLNCVRSSYGILLAVVGLQRFNSICSALGVVFLSLLFIASLSILHLSCVLAASGSLIATEILVCALVILIWRKKGKGCLGSNDPRQLHNEFGATCNRT